MQFLPTEIASVVLVQPTPIVDSRGQFARTWCQDEFKAAGLDSRLTQINSVNSLRAGTLRGLHFQIQPFGEAKTIQCLRGSAVVVAVDLRKESETYLKHVAVELSASKPGLLHVPEGFAQGYQTTMDDTEILYFMSAVYVPEAARGYRYDDPAFAIQWPCKVTQISSRDLEWPAFR